MPTNSYLLQSLFLSLHFIADQEPKALSQPPNTHRYLLWFLNEMAEPKLPSKKRGFYVRMRLLHSKHGRNPEKSFFFRYYKWVLWLSLSLYLFSSYFITNNNPNNKPTSLTKTHVSNSKSNLASRALFESTNASLQQSILDQGSNFFLSPSRSKFSIFFAQSKSLHFFFFVNRVIEGLKDFRVRFATELQHGLALKPAVYQTLVCLRGCNSQSFVEQRCSDF